MRTIKPAGLLPMVRVQAIGLPGRGCVSVTTVWNFNGPDAGKLCGDGELATTFTDEGSSVFDPGLPKVRGEVLAEGSSFSSSPVVARQVRLSLGSIDKKLYVVGDRVWEAGGPSAPIPFTKMRVSWENAFGGEGFAQNPVGKGKKPISVDGRKVHPLPNVEWPDNLIKSPGDTPRPAAFGPMDLTWESRMKRAGTYGPKWLKTRYPDMPEDFDPLFFQTAPEDQWMPAYFRGDESFVIENMHPEKAKLEGQLPGFVARAFVRTRTDDKGTDVPMHCDTVWFFPSVMRAALVFRGVFPVTVDDESEVTEVYCALEKAGAARPRSYYEEVRRKRLDKARGPMHSLIDADLLPEGVAIRKPKTDEGDQLLLDREGSLEQNLRKRAELELQNVRAKVQEAGLDPDKHLPKELPPDDKMGANDAVSFMETVDKRVDVIMKEAEEKRKEAMAEFRKQCEEQKIDPDEVIAREKKRSLGPPKFSAKKEIETLEGLRNLSEATGVEMPADVYEKLEDPRLEEKFHDIEAKLKDAYRATVHRCEAMPPLDEEDAKRVRAEVMDALRNGESLAQRDFSGVDLSGIDFKGADLSESFLESCKLEGCRFEGAILYRTVLAHADAKGCNFRGANLSGANVGGADLTGADFSRGADLTRVIFFKAKLSNGKLSGAKLDGADFSEAKLDGAVFSGCKAEEMTFAGVDLKEADFSGAIFEKCNFLTVDCSKANFALANLTQTVFLDTKGDGANFKGANLENLRVVKAEKGSSFARAVFDGANLSRANFRGVALNGATFVGASMLGADLSETDLTDAKLTGVRAAEARFERALLVNADFRYADLLGALLARARVAGANFEEANLFRADGAQMVGDKKTSFSGANLKNFRYVQNRGDDGQS